MRTIERRLATLETKQEVERLRVFFLSWVKPGQPKHRRMRVTRGDAAYLQEHGEAEEAFLSRVRAAVERDPPNGKCVALVFVQHVEWSAE